MRILIIEDEIEIANFLKNKLNNECFVSDVAYDGENGLSLALSNNYDLFILLTIYCQKNQALISAANLETKVRLPQS